MTTFFYFLQAIPECMGIVALSLALACVPLRWGRILIGGIFFASLIYIIRSLPVTFGLHLPIGMFILFLAIIYLTDIKPSRTIIAVFTSFMILTLLEFTISRSFFAFTHLDPEQIPSYEGLWAAVGVAQSIILIMIALLVPRYLRPAQEAWKK